MKIPHLQADCGIHYENARVNVSTQPISREKHTVERPRILPLPASTSRTFNVHWLERTPHHPASVMISSHSVSLHEIILNKTSYASYATEYFVCPHQLRFHNSLSNFTNFILHAYGWPPYRCATQFIKPLPM